MTTTTSASAKINNGVNVDALLGARTALEQAPEAAQFKWRASCEWLNGTHSRSAIGNFFGLGAEQSRNKTFTVEADHPQVFAAEDHAPTPVELVLSGLASCLTAGVAAVAQRRGIQLHSVKASLEADMISRASSASTMRCAMASAPFAFISTFAPMRAKTTSRRW